MDYNELYNTNSRFKEYVDKCAVSRNLPKEEIMKHVIVREYAKECLKKPTDEPTVHSVEMTVGCDRGC